MEFPFISFPTPTLNQMNQKKSVGMSDTKKQTPQQIGKKSKDAPVNPPVRIEEQNPSGISYEDDPNDSRNFIMESGVQKIPKKIASDEEEEDQESESASKRSRLDELNEKYAEGEETEQQIRSSLKEVSDGKLPEDQKKIIEYLLGRLDEVEVAPNQEFF